MERDEGMALASPQRMGWFESIRVGGWRGGKFLEAPVLVAHDAVVREIRGKRRRAAAVERVTTWREALRVRDRLTLEELAQLLVIEPVDTAESHPWCFVDLELDSAGTISELGLALDHRGELLVAEGTMADAAAFQELVAPRWVVAHNGDAHDFPILEQAGVSLGPDRADSMRLAWLAWPTALSHSLGALAERYGGARIDPLAAHHAGADAAVLAELWPHLVRSLTSIAEGTRGGNCRQPRIIDVERHAGRTVRRG